MELSGLGRALPALAISLAATGCAEASDDNAWTDAFEGRIETAFEGFGAAPGLTVVVVRRDRPSRYFHFGTFAEDPDGLHLIASITKSMVGLTGATLDARGDIDLDASLADAFPDIQFASDIPTEEIEVRDLLTHSSGLSNPGVDHRYKYSGLTERAQLDAALGRTALDPDAPPGSYAYNNFAYQLFGLFLENSTGEDWRDLVEDTVLDPLGMDDATLYVSRVPAERQVPVYFGGLESGPDEYDYPHDDRNASPSGAVYADREDMAAWMRAWLAPEETPLPTEAFSEAARIRTSLDRQSDAERIDGYGYGWFVGEYRGRRLITHSGSFFGAATHVRILPEAGLAAYAVTNEFPVSTSLVDYATQTALDLMLDVEESELTPPETFAAQAPERIALVEQMRSSVYGEVWRLSLPGSAYTGTFTDPAYGELVIQRDEDGALTARIGAAHTVLEPGPDPDTAGGAFVPYNDEVYRFIVENGQVSAIEFRSGRFERQAR